MKTRRIHKITMPWLAVVLGLSLPFASAVSAQQEEWNELNQRAVKLYRQGQSAEAIPMGQRALGLAEKTFVRNECCVPGIHDCRWHVPGLTVVFRAL